MFFGVVWGICTGMLISFLLVIQRTTTPHAALLGRIPGTFLYRSIVRFPTSVTIPGVTVFRWDSDLYFGNQIHFKNCVQTILERHQWFNKPVFFFVVDMHAVNNIDWSGIEALSAMRKMCAKKGIQVYFTGVKYRLVK